MKPLRILAGAAALLACGPLAAADLGDLSWLVGVWATEAKGPAVRWTEERWSPARGGMMLGTGLAGRGDKAISYEFMRIAVDDKGDIQFWGSPQGATPVPFRLVEASEGRVVFINPDHDYPQRIVYERTGYGMTATVSGKDGANPQSWRYKRIAE